MTHRATGKLFCGMTSPPGAFQTESTVTAQTDWVSIKKMANLSKWALARTGWVHSLTTHEIIFLHLWDEDRRSATFNKQHRTWVQRLTLQGCCTEQKKLQAKRSQHSWDGHGQAVCLKWEKKIKTALKRQKWVRKTMRDSLGMAELTGRGDSNLHRHEHVQNLPSQG